MIPFVPTTVSVVSATQDPPALCILPPITFEERFERDGKWLLGPHIIASIARHLRGKSLITKLDPPYQLTVSLPALPKVRNEIDGDYVDIYWSIPMELRSIFEDCYFEVYEVLAAEIDRVQAECLNMPATMVTVTNANMMLRHFEMRRVAIGEPALCQIFSERCGIQFLEVLYMSKPFSDMLEDNFEA